MRRFAENSEVSARREASLQQKKTLHINVSAALFHRFHPSATTEGCARSGLVWAGDDVDT